MLRNKEENERIEKEVTDLQLKKNKRNKEEEKLLKEYQTFKTVKFELDEDAEKDEVQFYQYDLELVYKAISSKDKKDQDSHYR